MSFRKQYNDLDRTFHWWIRLCVTAASLCKSVQDGPRAAWCRCLPTFVFLHLRSLAGEKFKWDVKTRKVPCVVERRNRRPLVEIYFYYRPRRTFALNPMLLRTEGKPVFSGHNSEIKLDSLSAPRLTFNIVISPEFVWVLPEPDRRKHDTKDTRGRIRAWIFLLVIERTCGIFNSEFIVVHVPEAFIMHS